MMRDCCRKLTAGGALSGSTRVLFQWADGPASVQDTPQRSRRCGYCAAAGMRVWQYTGGQTSADSFILHFPRVLMGIKPTDEFGAWGGRGFCYVTGPLGAPGGLGLAVAVRPERTIDSRLSKVAIAGPSEITTMLGPREAVGRMWPGAFSPLLPTIQALGESWIASYSSCRF